MKKINIIKKLSACLLAGTTFMSIGIVPVSAETISIATDTTDITYYEGYTFADYYAMSDEELIQLLGKNYTNGTFEEPTIVVYYSEDGLDTRDALIETYADSRNYIQPALLEDFCNVFGSIPTEYIEDVRFDSSNDSNLSDDVSDPDADEDERQLIPLYNGFSVHLKPPEGYVPGGLSTLDAETTKALYVIEKILQQSKDVYRTQIACFDLSRPPRYLGDINLDYDVNLCDVILLEKAVAGTVELDEAQTVRADCNDNGEPDADDAYLLLRFVLQIIDTLPGS